MQAILFIVCSSAFLVGCATSSPPPSGCLKTALVSSLSKAPVRPVLKQETRLVTLSGVKRVCRASSGPLSERKRSICITMALTMPEARQKHGTGRKVAFPVFVALLDKEDNVLDRQDEKIRVTISDRSLNHTHTILYHLPEGIEADSENHRLLVGFKGRVMPVHVPVSPNTSQLTQRARWTPQQASRVSASRKKLAHKKKWKGKKKYQKKKGFYRKKSRKLRRRL